uniref:Magnesium transporter n=1 Tax=Zea mays TaxID=4577 RepID=A0A804NB62_MAIZE
MGSLTVVSIKAIGVAIKLTLDGVNQAAYPYTWLFLNCLWGFSNKLPEQGIGYLFFLFARIDLNISINRRWQLCSSPSDRNRIIIHRLYEGIASSAGFLEPFSGIS